MHTIDVLTINPLMVYAQFKQQQAHTKRLNILQKRFLVSCNSKSSQWHNHV